MDSCESSNVVATYAKAAILIVMGLPGSGKTTLCHSLPHVLGNKFHVIHICYDQVVPFKEDWKWEEKHGSWKCERNKVLEATDSLLCHLIHGSSSPKEKGHHKKDISLCNPILTHKICRNLDLKIKCERNNAPFSVETNDHNPCGHGLSDLSENVDFTCDNFVTWNVGHYTVVDSVNENVIFILDKLKCCDFPSELFVLCVDDNFYYRSMRKEWWNLAAKYKLPFGIVALRCELSVCFNRVRERLNSTSLNHVNVPEDVIGRMSERIEFPDGNLNPWEKNSVVIDSDSLHIFVDEGLQTSPQVNVKVMIDAASWQSLNKIKQLLNDSLLQPAEPLRKMSPSDNSPIAPSIVHLVDLALRRFVGNSDVTIRPQINKKRKIILEELRNGKLAIPRDIFQDVTNTFENRIDEYVASLINTDS